jgi:hypothetical protein
MPPLAVDPAVTAFRRVTSKQWHALSGKAAINTALAIFKENHPPKLTLSAWKRLNTWSNS